MNRIYLLIILSSFSVFAYSQEKNSGINYSKSITAEELKTHLEIIASDEFEGRETGKKGQKMAMEYLINNFKELNIQAIPEFNYVQKFPLIEQENKEIFLEIDSEDLELFKDFYLFNTYLKDTLISTEVHFAGFGLEEKKYKNISGKAALLLAANPKDSEEKEIWDLGQRITYAKEKGASVAIVIAEDFEEKLHKYEHNLQKKRMFLADENLKSSVPTIYISPETAEEFIEGFSYKKYLRKAAKKQSKYTAQIELKINKPSIEYVSENVLAYIPGTDLKEELVVITAHYDHIGMNDSLIFNGADDDGTGTVALLEIAEAFMKAKEEGNAPRRSILIMPVSGEEKGLLGSRFYSEHPVFPLENTVANLNVDMIGRIDEKHEGNANYIYLIGADRLSQDLHDISKGVAQKYFDLELDYTFNDKNDPNRFYYRSDHYNFAKHNIPSVFYFSGVHEDYHKATDTVDKILFDKVEKVSRLIFMTAWEIANREERLQLNGELN